MIKRITRADKKALKQVNALMKEWSATAKPLTSAYFKKLIKESYVLGLYDKQVLAGTVTIVPLHKLSGLKGSIEHVLISEKYRGQGLGKQLMRSAIASAKKRKMKMLVLTCEPHRKAAKHIYETVGFVAKNTQFYELKL